jgi:hypothetical protein
MTNLLPSIKWRFPCCGGEDAHGTMECDWDDSGDRWICNCQQKPSNFNFMMHNALAVEIHTRKLHVESSVDNWTKFAMELFSQRGVFKTYAQIQGPTLRQRFFGTMIADVKFRHGLDNGYETHPEISKYDSLMLGMIKDIEEKEAKGKEAQDHIDANKRACLAISEEICPAITRDGEGIQATPNNEHSNRSGGSSGSNKRNAEEDSFLSVMRSIGGSPDTRKRRLEIEEARVDIERHKTDIQRMNAETERLKAQNEANRIQLEAAKASDAAKMTNLLLAKLLAAQEDANA